MYRSYECYGRARGERVKVLKIFIIPEKYTSIKERHINESWLSQLLW